MLDITTLLEQLKTSPYEEVTIFSPHTGIVTFNELNIGDKVIGPSGVWKEKPGTLLATLTRERNSKPIYNLQKGYVATINKELEGTFVQARTPLLVIRHFLSKDEVLQLILQKALHIFSAPERAKYYFTQQIDTKVRTAGCKSIIVYNGMELFIVSRMKRETPLHYSGPEGIIYATYFQHNENVSAGSPLIGICPENQLKQIEDVVLKVQTEWQEQE